jgi:hypothetical protein
MRSLGGVAPLPVHACIITLLAANVKCIAPPIPIDPLNPPPPAPPHTPHPHTLTQMYTKTQSMHVSILRSRSPPCTPSRRGKAYQLYAAHLTPPPHITPFRTQTLQANAGTRPVPLRLASLVPGLEGQLHMLSAWGAVVGSLVDDAATFLLVLVLCTLLPLRAV